LIKNIVFGALEKVDGSRFFWSDFDNFYRKWGLYGFIEKQAPQKALCLGPDPPPGEKMKFIEKTRFLLILGPSIEPEKASVKSASTANPPLKSDFMGVFIISRPNFGIVCFLYLVLGILSFTLPFFGPWNWFTLGKTQQFFCLFGLLLVRLVCFLLCSGLEVDSKQTNDRPPPKRGV
jgi:hypothetical protein